MTTDITIISTEDRIQRFCQHIREWFHTHPAWIPGQHAWFTTNRMEQPSCCLIGTFFIDEWEYDYTTGEFKKKNYKITGEIYHEIETDFQLSREERWALMRGWDGDPTSDDDEYLDFYNAGRALYLKLTASKGT